MRLVAPGECGTHGIVDAAFGPVGTGEQTLAGQLITRFTPDMLVLADRNFYSYQAWCQAVKAHLIGVAIGAQPAPRGVAEAAPTCRPVQGERPVFDLPDQPRRHPPNDATGRWASRPATRSNGPANGEASRCKGLQQIQQTATSGVGEPGADIPDIDQHAVRIVRGEQQRTQHVSTPNTTRVLKPRRVCAIRPRSRPTNVGNVGAVKHGRNTARRPASEHGAVGPGGIDRSLSRVR